MPAELTCPLCNADGSDCIACYGSGKLPILNPDDLPDMAIGSSAILSAEFAPLAERIHQLEADNLMLVQERAKLREALEAFVKWDSFGLWDIGCPLNLDDCMRNARAALACQQEPKPQ